MKKTSPITFSPIKFVTPIATAKWCHLAQPRNDERFNTVNYECTAVLDPNDKEVKAFIAKVNKCAAELCKGIGKPVPDMRWIRDNDDGTISMSFKRAVRDGRDKPIPVLDTAKQPCKEPWGGDSIRVAFSIGLWKTAMGYGIKPYPIAVQVTERGNGLNKNVADAFPDLEVAESSTDIPF